MQTLGLSESTPRTEGRIKSLLWPTIKNQGDVEYVALQGFWVCFVVSVLTLVFGAIRGQAFQSLFDSLFFFLAGVGVRQRSRLAGVLAFVGYLLSALVAQRFTGQGFGIATIIFLALLLSNLRGMWLASKWEKTEPLEEMPRLSVTFGDKISDQFPKWLWPKGKYLFYCIAVLEMLGLLFLLLTPALPGLS